MSELETIYSTATLRKARKLADEEFAVQRDAQDEGIWWVKGSNGTKYRVQFVLPLASDEDEATIPLDDDMERDGVRVGDYVNNVRVIPPIAGVPLMTCTCPNGANRGGRPQCYHSCAVLLVLQRISSEGYTPPTMTDPSPLNEDFLGDERAEELRAQGYTQAEIDFLRS